MTAAAQPVPVSAGAVALSERVHWIGALDPTLRVFDIILKTANGTTYNAYAVRGSDGVAVVDTVKDGFAGDFFRRLEQVADYGEIKAVVLNHLEPDHSGALPELLRRAPQARLYVSFQAQLVLKGLIRRIGAVPRLWPAIGPRPDGATGCGCRDTSPSVGIADIDNNEEEHHG